MPRLSLLLLILLAGCATQKGSVRPGDNGAGRDTLLAAVTPMPDDSAVIAVRALEADPTAPAAPALRKRLFEWVLTSKSLRGFDASTRPIDDLERSEYPYKDELMMQFIFGGAAWRIAADSSADLTMQQEAGVRSLLAAYRNVIQFQPSLRDQFLDRLDELRRRGELRGYIQRGNAGGAR
jgi:hypothetical protein